MYNKNKIYNEVSRMIELFESDNSKVELIKNSIIKKSQIKEELDFSDLFDDLEDNGEGDSKTNEIVPQYSSSDDISLIKKLALVSYSINKLQAAMFNLESKNFLNIQDLKTAKITPSDENDAVVSKSSKLLYPNQSVKDFVDMLEKGRLVLNIGNEKEETEEGEVKRLFKWLGGVKNTKTLNQIGLTTSGKVSQEGNATLNFLARILSDNPKDEVESKIISTFGNAAKSNAMKILLDFYQVAAVNHLLPILNMQPTPENLDAVKDGVVEALNNLAGVRGSLSDLKSTNWDSSKNVSPWVFQVAKNYAKNILKKVTEYTPDLSAAQRVFDNMLSKEGEIIIPSRKDPSHENYADKVEKVGDKYLYYYSNVEDAMDDLSNSTKIPNHHLKSYNLEISKFKDLFNSERKAPSTIDSKEAENIASDEKDVFGIDKSAELEIRKILGNVVDFMTLDSKKYGIKQATHDPNYLSVKDKEELKSGKSEELIRKRKELAKENAVNFIFNFLLSAIGETKYGTDIGETGKINPEVINQWIESQRKSILTKLIELEKKNNPNIPTDAIKKRAEELGLLIKGDKFAQSFKNGLRDYFTSNKEDLSKIIKLISSTSPKGYEVETDIDTIFENKIRTKIKKMLKESFTLNEEEKEDFKLNVDDLNQKIKIFGDRFAKATTYDRGVLDSEIEDVISGRMSKWNFENGANGQHNYITSVLASLYNSLNGKAKENIVKYVFLSFFPRQEKSRLIDQLSFAYSRSRNKLNDLVWDALITPENNGKLLFVNALENYEPKGTFFQYLKQRIKNQISNTLRGSEYSYVETSFDDAPDFNDFEGGEEYGEKTSKRKMVQKKSIDAPSREGDEDNRGFELKADDNSGIYDELKDKLNSYLEKAEQENILSKSEMQLLRAIQVYGNDVMEDDKINYELLSNRIGKSVSNIGSTMSNIMKKMKNARKDKDMFKQ
jgi:hypothetical protein